MRTPKTSYSPFFAELRWTDGPSLISVVSYAQVPSILMAFREIGEPTFNRKVARTVGMDESLCLKLIKWLANNELVYAVRDKASQGKIYSLTKLGEKCADAFIEIRSYASEDMESEEVMKNIKEKTEEKEELRT